MKEKLAVKDQKYLNALDEKEAEKNRAKNDIRRLELEVEELRQRVNSKNNETDRLKEEVKFLEERIHIINSTPNKEYSPLIINKN